MKLKLALVVVIAVLCSYLFVNRYNARYQSERIAELQNYGVSATGKMSVLHFEESERDANVKTYCAHSTSTISLPPSAIRSNAFDGIATDGQVEMLARLCGRQLDPVSLQNDGRWQYGGEKVRGYVLRCRDGDYLYLQAVK